MSSVSLRYSAGAICASLLAVLLISCGSSSPEQSSTPTETETPAVDEASSDTGQSAAEISSSAQRLSMSRVTPTQANEAISLTLDLMQELPTTSLVSLRTGEAAAEVCNGLEDKAVIEDCNYALDTVNSVCEEIDGIGLSGAVIDSVDDCRFYFQAMLVAFADQESSDRMCHRLENDAQVNLCRDWASNMGEYSQICDLTGREREMCLAAVFRFLADLWDAAMTPMLNSVADADCEASLSDLERDRCTAVAAITPMLEAVCGVISDYSDRADCQSSMSPIISYAISWVNVSFAAVAPCYESYEEGPDIEDCLAIAMFIAGKALCSELPIELPIGISGDFCFDQEEMCDYSASSFGSGKERCLDAMSRSSEGCAAISEGPEKEGCQIAERGCSAITVTSRQEDCLAAIRGMKPLIECVEIDESERVAYLGNQEDC